MSTDTTLILKSRRRNGTYRPVVHIMMPDGRVTEFKDRGIVIPDSNNAAGDDEIFALLINQDGVPCITPDGNLAVTAVPLICLGVKPNPDQLLSYKDVAKLMGASNLTVKRLVGSGELPKPHNISERAVRFRQSEVEAAITNLRKKRT